MKNQIKISATNISSEYTRIVLDQQNKLFELNNKTEDYLRAINDLSIFTRKAEIDLT